MEVSGHDRPAVAGISNSFEGSSRQLLNQPAKVLAVQRAREKIEQMLREQALLTAFKPVQDLTEGRSSESRPDTIRRRRRPGTLALRDRNCWFRPSLNSQPWNQHSPPRWRWRPACTWR